MSELIVKYDLGAAETDAAIRAKLIEMGWTPPGQGQPSAEPAGYFHNITAGGDLIQRWEQSEWAEDGAVPLYAHPATAELEALRSDAEIGKLVRLKMTSGNSVPVERCIITAAEIAAIAQQEPSHDN